MRQFSFSAPKLSTTPLPRSHGRKIQTLTVNGGVVRAVDVWGKKRLAYAINYETEGYYALISFEAEPSFPKELDRVANITDGVLRAMTIKK